MTNYFSTFRNIAIIPLGIAVSGIIGCSASALPVLCQVGTVTQEKRIVELDKYWTPFRTSNWSTYSITLENSNGTLSATAIDGNETVLDSMINQGDFITLRITAPNPQTNMYPINLDDVVSRNGKPVNLRINCSVKQGL